MQQSAPSTRGPRTITARKLVRATGGSAATTLWLAALGLVTTPYLLNNLGAAAYGVFALITIVTGYLSNLEFGFGHALIRFASRARAVGDREAERRVLETSLAIFCIGGVTGALTAFLLAPLIVGGFATVPALLQGEAEAAMRAGALILFVTFLSNFCGSALTALGHFGRVSWVRVGNGTLVSAAAVTVVALGGGIDHVLIAQLVVVTGSVCVMAVSLMRIQSYMIVPRPHRDTLRAMARFSGLVFLGGIAYQLMLQGPPTVLAGHAGTAEVAAYAVPAVVSQQLVLLATSASLGFLPFASAESASADTERLASIYSSHMRLTLLVMGPLAAYLAIFADEILTTWISAEFAAGAADPLRFLGCAAMVIALIGPSADVARGLNRPSWIVLYTGSAAVIEVALALTLVSSHGATGVAAAVLAGPVLLGMPLVVSVCRRLLRASLRALIRSLTGPALAAGGATSLYAAGAAVSDGIVPAIVTGLVVLGAYVPIVHRYILRPPERGAFALG